MVSSGSMYDPSDLKKPVCVFCGSSPGSSALYSHAARAVGRALAEEGVPVVYGGGRKGLMGSVSQAALDAGGFVHGIVPAALTERNMVNSRHPEYSDVDKKPAQSAEGRGETIVEGDEDRMTTEITASMHERKLRMAQISTGGFVVLPGGYGTFEEMLEMTTWNQLGIHRLPVIALNIGNLYSPLRQLLEKSVDAGFIQPQNLSLLRIIDLPGDASDNEDESKADQWGEATVKALKDWSLSETAGFGLSWNQNVETAPKSNGGGKSCPSYVFTTMRYTSPDPNQPTLPITENSIPLLGLHFARLKGALNHFIKREDVPWYRTWENMSYGEKWKDWPGDTVVWDILRSKIEQKEEEGRGDWRVRLVIYRKGIVEAQLIPLTVPMPPFRSLPTPQRSEPTRPLVLDPEAVDVGAESTLEKDLRLHKTDARHMYDSASSRAAAVLPSVDHPEVLLHTDTHLLETATSNIAIQFPTEHGHRWITPRLDEESRPFLNGVMRQHLLSTKVLEEGDLTVEDYQRAKREKLRVIGFNGLRGVWEAELV